MMCVEQKLNEAFNHVKNYLNDTDDEDVKVLHQMCSYCERYNGQEHDFSECRGTPCFNCWLAYVYLQWETSF